MKTILIINIILIVLVAFSGCDEFLDNTKLVNLETEETGFYSEAHADQTIVAIYADIRTKTGLNGIGGLVLFDMASADLKMILEANAVNNYTFNSSFDDPAFGRFWERMYSIIGRCNSSIEIVPGTEAPAEKISRYNSEAKVLRSIMYYHLMMTYNTCPLILETIDPGDKERMLTGDASREEIYDAMIQDLEETLSNTNFPWEKNLPSNEKGHVGQATARIVLTYYYLSRGWENGSVTDFEKAKIYAKELIDNGGYSLEPILLDAYYKPYNTESIFELNASNSALGLGSGVNEWFVPYILVDWGYENVDKDIIGWYKMVMTQKLYDTIEDGDARRFMLGNPNHGNNKYWAPKFLGGDKYGGPILIPSDVNDDVFGLPTYQNSKAAGSPRLYMDKLAGEPGSGATWIIYRLSDVFLLYAEACIKTNDFAEARKYINKVRERARNAWTAHLSPDDPDIPTHIEGIPADIQSGIEGDQLLQVLKHERRVELYSEMKRMIDIRRWSLGGASDLEDEVNISGTWSNKFKWYPKPQDEVDLSQGNVIQNPGY